MADGKRESGVETMRRFLPILRDSPADLPEGEDLRRPTTRADCLVGGRNQARPCPWAACSFHLAVEVDLDTGALTEVWPDVELAPVTCVLDVVDVLGDQEQKRRLASGAHRFELDRATVGHYLKVSTEWVRRIEERAWLQLARELRYGQRWSEDGAFKPPEGRGSVNPDSVLKRLSELRETSAPFGAKKG